MGQGTGAALGDRRGAAAFAFGLVLGLPLAACDTPSRAPASTAARGAGAVEARVEFADLDRIHATLQGLRGRPLFVNFWATWCVPCVDELPDLAALAREDDVAGGGFLGVSLDAWITGNGAETEDKVRRALAAAGVGYPNLIYRGDQDPLIEGLDLPGPIPYSVLYDGQGKRVASWTGPAAIEEVRRAIAAGLPRTRATAADPPPAASDRR
jgi:thiol-disulfide isomerase/thioredoxin